jgi:hypothetical protein
MTPPAGNIVQRRPGLRRVCPAVLRMGHSLLLPSAPKTLVTLPARVYRNFRFNQAIDTLSAERWQSG